MRFRAAAIAALAVFASAAGAEDAVRAATGDAVVYRENGAKKTRTGVVVETAAYDQVVISQAGRRTTLDGADVVEIRWSDAPREYENAVAALRAGDAAGAAAGFDAALRNRATQRGWLAEHGNAGLGEALLAIGRRDPQNAARAVLAFGVARESNAKSLVTDVLLAGTARAEIVRGRFDTALAAADELFAAAQSAKRPDWHAEALLVRIEARAAKGDVAGALRVADETLAHCDARTAAAKDADLAGKLRRASIRASVAKLWLLVDEAEATRTPEAAEAARKFAAEIAAKWDEEPSVEAASTTASGALLLLSGDTKQALRRFKETEVLHFDVADAAARALWYAARALEKSGDREASLAAVRQLEGSYPDTEWAHRPR